jgi:hypothetical protein
MLVRRTSRRPCRDYEREWNGYCVDKNLQDEWLICLNHLEAFNLISICEGHCGHQAEASRVAPHIKLRLKEHLLADVSRYWNEYKMAIVSKVNGLFQAGDTYVGLELKFKLRSRTGRMNYEESLMVGIHGRHRRASEEMDAETRDWFQRGVGHVKELDDFVMGLWRGSQPDA